MPPAVDVTVVASRSDLKSFLRLPWSIYPPDPHWVPPLLRLQARELDPDRHAFYQDAERELFLARRGGQVVGRIAAIVNHAHNRRHDDRVGFFGYFECISDQAVGGALFRAAGEWLAARGMEAIRGPVSPSMNASCGLLIEGFDSSPYILMPYNPPYYADLIQAAGLRKIKDLYAYRILAERLGDAMKRLDRIASAMFRRHPDLTIRTIEMKRYEEEVHLFSAVFEQARTDNWGHVPMSRAEVTALAREMKPLLKPHFLLIAEVAGKPAGCTLALLDVNRLIKPLNGRLFPFGFLRLMTGLRRLHRARVFGIATLPEYRPLGVTAVLLSEFLRRGIRGGCFEAEASWVLEDNYLSNRTLSNTLRPERYKTYRLYERKL